MVIKLSRLLKIIKSYIKTSIFISVLKASRAYITGYKKDPRHWFFLIIILALFLITRLLYISKVPASVYWDEASIGYNAYSISETLKDEWGEFLPIHFRAFGEFKLPVYIYSTAIFVKIFGLNEFSVRFASVIFSLGTLIFSYLLSRQLTKNKVASLFAPFFLVFSPWFFIFSRTGYEVTAGIFFLIMSFYFFIIGINKNYYLFGWIISSILAVYSYNSMRIIIPFILIFQLILLFRMKVSIRYIAFSILIFIIAIIPILRLILLDAGTGRFIAVGEKGYSQIIINYLSHFAPKFLFQGDANPRSTLPGFGLTWLHEIIILAAGLWLMSKKTVKWGNLIIFSFLISFFPSALTKEAPHALRSLPAVIFLAILYTFGIIFLTQRYRKLYLYIIIGTVLFTFFSFEAYIKEFVENYNKSYSSHWQYGYSRIYLDYQKEIENAKKVIISDEYGQPYIFALFYRAATSSAYRAATSSAYRAATSSAYRAATSSAYLNFNPNDFLETKKLNPVANWGASTVSSFDKFEFGKVSQEKMIKGNLVFSENKVGDTPHTEIKNLDGTTALFVYEN